MRSYDLDRLNYLINHKDIRPFIGGDGESELDFAPLMKDENYFLSGEHGGFFCQWTAPGTYEIHTFVLPEGRGPWAYDFARQGRDYMVSQGASHLWTRIPEGAGNIKAFTLRAGFKRCGEQELDLGCGPVRYELFDWRP
jgi:hypothetical protein